MCEIKPKRTMIFRLEFFTSLNMTQEQFEQLVIAHALKMEAAANEDSRIRCHVHACETGNVKNAEEMV